VYKVVARLIARVRARTREDWEGPPGERFRKTIDDLTEGQGLESAVTEAAKRFAVGKVSHEHSEAVRNYAEEEKAKQDAELARRTLPAKVRQEYARAEQEEAKSRMLRNDELAGRIKLVDELQKCNVLPIWDRDGNITFVKAPAGFNWEKRRELFVQGVDIGAVADLVGEDDKHE